MADYRVIINRKEEDPIKRVDIWEDGADAPFTPEQLAEATSLGEWHSSETSTGVKFNYRSGFLNGVSQEGVPSTTYIIFYNIPKAGELTPEQNENISRVLEKIIVGTTTIISLARGMKVQCGLVPAPDSILKDLEEALE
jgi:hypothetical protein